MATSTTILVTFESHARVIREAAEELLAATAELSYRTAGDGDELDTASSAHTSIVLALRDLARDVEQLRARATAEPRAAGKAVPQ